MEIRQVLSAAEIDLSEPRFWLRPAEEREGAFATLWAERPVPWTEDQLSELRLARSAVDDSDLVRCQRCLQSLIV